LDSIENRTFLNIIEDIKSAVRTLPDEDLKELRAWFDEFDSEVWDRQFERDVAAGKLDAFAEEALRSVRKSNQ